MVHTLRGKVEPIHLLKAYRRIGGIQLFFTVALDGGEWSASLCKCLNPPPIKRKACTHWIGGWVGVIAGLYVVEMRRICYPEIWTKAVEPGA